jgi:tetratricopeptide (TPR) repeat protein
VRLGTAVDEWRARFPQAVLVEAPPAATWPFRHPLAIDLPPTPAILWAADVHEACINRQTGSTRLVTTQLTYLFEVWRAATAGRDDVLIVATADGELLQEHAPEALNRRGPFRDNLIEIVPPSLASPQASFGETGPPSLARTHASFGETSQTRLLAQAMRVDDPAERLALCVKALEDGRTAPALLATASACMEVNDLEAAARDLDEALGLMPEWAAAWFERGKVWLRVDDMERASTAFREAAERLPAFVSAWANLGATCGELDRPEEALAAFEHALAYDPANSQVLNNIGVVNRELGRLAESEAAFRQVTTLTPNLAFGYYNLGHTLFLQARYQAALTAYSEGQRRDAERNPVQATRLAICRLATGDANAALRDLQQASAGLPREYRRQLLADASAIAWALLTHKPDLPGWKHVNDWLGGELPKLA